MRILVADTETTGVSAKEAKLVEVAWVEVDKKLNIINSFQSLVDPEIPIPPDAMGVHGITNDDVKHAPTADELFDFVLKDEDFSEVCLVCHNLVFDRKFLTPFMNVESGLCTLKAARKYYPDAPNHKLNTLVYFLDLPVNRDAHRALADVEVTLNLLKTILEEAEITFEDLIKDLSKPQQIKTMPFGKHKGVYLEELPKGYVNWLKSLDLDPDLKWSLDQLG